MDHLYPKHINHKKNATGFFLFSKEIRSQIHKACPFFSPLDISKVISEQWKNLPESERIRYREMAKSIVMQSTTALNAKSPPISITKQNLIPPIETFGICPLFENLRYFVPTPPKIMA